MAGESGVNQMEGAKEIEAPNLVRRSLPNKWKRADWKHQRRVHEGNTPKDAAKWWGLISLIRWSPYSDNREITRLCQDCKSCPSTKI